LCHRAGLRALLSVVMDRRSWRPRPRMVRGRWKRRPCRDKRCAPEAEAVRGRLAVANHGARSMCASRWSLEIDVRLEAALRCVLRSRSVTRYSPKRCGRVCASKRDRTGRGNKASRDRPVERHIYWAVGERERSLPQHSPKSTSSSPAMNNSALQSPLRPLTSKSEQ